MVQHCKPVFGDCNIQRDVLDIVANGMFSDNQMDMMESHWTQDDLMDACSFPDIAS